MAEIIKLRSNPHEEVLQLIPWFLNGTLEEDELRRVEAHLAECTECRDDLAAERQLAQAIASSPVEREAAWQHMEQKLQATQDRRLSPVALASRKRRALRWAFALPVAAAAALALVVVNLPSRPQGEPQYRALGSAEAPVRANLVVQFQPATRVSDMKESLQSVDARVVDGPTVTGAYLLRVNPSRRDAALKRLRDDQTIALAQPIDGPTRE